MSELQDALTPEYVSMMENWAVSQSEYRKIHAVIEAARNWADLLDDVREAVKGKTGNAILMTADEIGERLGITEDTA